MKLPGMAGRLIAAALALWCSHASADVWVADRATLYKIDPATPHVILSVAAVKTIALVVDGRDGAVWTLSDTTLVKRTSLGAQSVAVDLNSLDMSGADSARQEPPHAGVRHAIRVQSHPERGVDVELGEKASARA